METPKLIRSQVFMDALVNCYNRNGYSENKFPSNIWKLDDESHFAGFKMALGMLREANEGDSIFWCKLTSCFYFILAPNEETIVTYFDVKEMLEA